MSPSIILQIRDTIQSAIEAEAHSHSLQSLTKLTLNSVHHSIALPNEDQTQLLQQFLHDYIGHVPDCIETIITIAQETGIKALLQPLIDIAANYFLLPPKTIEEGGGLCALLGGAYLAHRLFEEVNDKIMMHCGVPITPMNMTKANLLVHSMIGDAFANKLDMAVLYSVKTLFNDDLLSQSEGFSAFMEQQRGIPGLDSKTIGERWPCFANDSAIGMKLPSDLDDLGTGVMH